MQSGHHAAGSKLFAPATPITSRWPQHSTPSFSSGGRRQRHERNLATAGDNGAASGEASFGGFAVGKGGGQSVMFDEFHGNADGRGQRGGLGALVGRHERKRASGRVGPPGAADTVHVGIG